MCIDLYIAIALAYVKILFAGKSCYNFKRALPLNFFNSQYPQKETCNSPQPSPPVVTASINHALSDPAKNISKSHRSPIIPDIWLDSCVCSGYPYSGGSG